MTRHPYRRTDRLTPLRHASIVNFVMTARRLILICLTLVYIALGASVPLVRCEVPNGHVQVEYAHRACPELNDCGSQSEDRATAEAAPASCKDTPIRSAEWTMLRGPDDELAVALSVEASPIKLFAADTAGVMRAQGQPLVIGSSSPGVVLRALRTVVLTV